MAYQLMHLGSGLRFTALSISFQTSLSFQRGLSCAVSLSDVADCGPNTGIIVSILTAQQECHQLDFCV